MPKNCEYSDYLSDSKYLKCKCNIEDKENIEIIEPEKITAKSVTKTFYKVLKYSNYKVLKCYKLVFREVTIIKNVGSILSNIYFIGYLISFCLFLYYKKLSYLQNEIKKLIRENKNIDKNSFGINKLETITIDKIKNDKRNDKLIQVEHKEKDNKINNIVKKKKRNNIKYKNKNIKSNRIIDLKNINSKKIIEPNPLANILNENNNIPNKDISSNRLAITPAEALYEINQNKLENKKPLEILTDYELND